MLDARSCARALASRDPRFDGVFFVGISTTRIYCRPVCPARVAYPDHRRFFPSAAAAERDGFRPCLRCRPELAPGRALVDAVPRVARAAALRIAAGALNGQGVGELAHELGVGERQLRRAMERELGVSPLELAQTHRLLLAKCLLTDTTLPVTRVAFASGFQSLRRFNTAFHERYRMSPSRLRRHASAPARTDTPGAPVPDLVRLTLSYRAPLAWTSLLAELANDGLPDVAAVEGRRYGRTVALAGCRGIVLIEDTPIEADRGRRASPAAHLDVQVSASLLPALMPLLARLRHLLDLDAEPAVIDAHLAQSGLGAEVRARPGLRLPGGFDGFEIATRELLGSSRLAARLVEALGQPIRTASPLLTRLAPTPDRIAAAGPSVLTALGVPRRRAEPLDRVARAVASGALRLEPGADVPSTLRMLRDIPGLGERTATTIVMRALHWPDAFPATDATLQRAARADGPSALIRMAERWRPWRAYGAAHLRLGASRSVVHQRS